MSWRLLKALSVMLLSGFCFMLVAAFLALFTAEEPLKSVPVLLVLSIVSLTGFFLARREARLAKQSYDIIVTLENLLKNPEILEEAAVLDSKLSSGDLTEDEFNRLVELMSIKNPDKNVLR